jgi:hypothetical protein
LLAEKFEKSQDTDTSHLKEVVHLVHQLWTFNPNVETNPSDSKKVIPIQSYFGNSQKVPQKMKAIFNNISAFIKFDEAKGIFLSNQLFYLFFNI